MSITRERGTIFEVFGPSVALKGSFISRVSTILVSTSSEVLSLSLTRVFASFLGFLFMDRKVFLRREGPVLVTEGFTFFRSFLDV